MILTIIILLILLIISIFFNRNLLLKNEKQEDMLFGYNTYLNKISDVIQVSSEKLKQIDYKGTFESDDEVGFFFQQIKTLQEILNNFIIKSIK